MTTYYLPDLSGQNSDYQQVNQPCFVYKVGQKVTFENSPIFVASLTLTMTDGTGRTLVKDIDWIVDDDDVDETAMSRAYLENPLFSGNLAKSVTIISNKALNMALAMTYQEFYLTIPGRTFDDGTPFEVTPDLIKSHSTAIAAISQQIARVSSPVAPNDNVPVLLAFDINKEKSANQITNEVITVNTVAGAKVIRLAQGAFFADSVVLKYNNTTLNPQTDYLPIVLSPLTNQSLNKGGIYQYIYLTGAYTGNVTASYHALGGEVQVTDINAVWESMVAIKTYLNNAIFVTSDTISETQAFRAFNARLNLLEDGMRRLLTGSPTYGDTSTGSAVTRPVQTEDADFHWWTIATLYQVEGSTDIIQADMYRGRVYFAGSKIALAFSVDVNMAQSRNKVDFKTESVIFDPQYTLFTDLGVGTPKIPMLRVVWNMASETFSGACIQVGIPLTTLQDTMVVEDLSSSESCWIMSRKNEFILGSPAVDPSSPEDSGFTLPDGVSTWSPTSGVSYESTYIPTFDEGYLAYAGSTVALSDLVTTDSTADSFNIVLPTYFPAQNIKSLVVTVASSDSTVVYDVEIPMLGFEDNARMGRATFVDSLNEAMAFLVTMDQDALNNISISINIAEIANPLATGTPSTKTDLIRYIRAKV